MSMIKPIFNIFDDHFHKVGLGYKGFLQKIFNCCLLLLFMLLKTARISSIFFFGCKILFKNIQNAIFNTLNSKYSEIL